MSSSRIHSLELLIPDFLAKKNKKAIELIPFPSFNPEIPLEDKFGNLWHFEKFKVQKKTGKTVLQYRKQAYLDTAFKPIECVYCGIFVTAKNITRDHIRPRAYGFVLEPGNVILCCQSCNGRKACRNLGEWIYAEFMSGDKSYYFLIRSRIQRYLDLNPSIDSSDWTSACKLIDSFF